TFDFSGLNGPNNIQVFRGITSTNADTYSLSNFGTNIAGGTLTTFQHLDVSLAVLAQNTINFGSGAYVINDNGHTRNAYVNTAANGAGLPNVNAFEEQWALITGVGDNNTLNFAGDTGVQTITKQPGSNFQTFFTNATATPIHTVSWMFAGGNTFIFDHADSS